MPYASMSDCTLYYETGGTGTPVVYIHGGFASLDTLLRDLTPNQWGWEYDFAASFSFVSYDRRGCYRSSSPETGYDLWTQVRDLTDLLDHLHIETVHLIGSSAGGPIALLFAATQPQRTRSLILVGTALDLFPAGEPGSDVVRQHLAILERDGADRAFDQRPAEVEVTFSELWDHTEAKARGTLDEYRTRQHQWRAEAQALS
jgi:pimeloyl-ACP methyl ester carboxylesterase